MPDEGLFQIAARLVFPVASAATTPPAPVKPQNFADLRQEAEQMSNGKFSRVPSLFVSLDAVRQAVFARTLEGKIHSDGAMPQF